MTGGTYAAVKGVVTFLGVNTQVSDTDPQTCIYYSDQNGAPAADYDASTRLCKILSGAPTGGGQINNVDTTYIYVAQPGITATLAGYQYSNPSGTSFIGIVERE